MYKKLEYFSDVCDRTKTIMSGSNDLRSLTHNQLWICVHIKHTVEKPDFFDKDSIFHDCITEHYKNWIVSC